MFVGIFLTSVDVQAYKITALLVPSIRGLGCMVYEIHVFFIILLTFLAQLCRGNYYCLSCREPGGGGGRRRSGPHGKSQV